MPFEYTWLRQRAERSERYGKKEPLRYDRGGPAHESLRRTRQGGDDQRRVRHHAADGILHDERERRKHHGTGKRKDEDDGLPNLGGTVPADQGASGAGDEAAGLQGHAEGLRHRPDRGGAGGGGGGAGGHPGPRRSG